MILSPNFSVARVNSTSLFSYNKKYYTIKEVKRYGPICTVTLEKVDLKTYTLTGEIIEISGDMFQEGTGFGGLPACIQTYGSVKCKNGIFYCDL